MTDQPIFVRQDRVLKKIDLSQIIVLAAANNYIEFHSPGQYFMVRSSLDAALQLLSSERFVRIHRSFAVSIDHVVEITKDSVLMYDAELPVARKYYPELLKRIKVIGEASGQKEGRLNLKRDVGE